MRNLFASLLHLFYPHVCETCSRGLARSEQILCIRCQHKLPVTKYQCYAGNPLEKVFWGRANIRHAMAAYHYTQASMIQQLIHQFKYRDRQDIAIYLGRQAGHLLLQSTWLHEIDCIVPVPLHPAKARRRGYNQAALLAEGLSGIIHKPVLPKALRRSGYTGTQTRKSRISRWENVCGLFAVKEPGALRGRHILLVDDVVTTGATTEACCHALLEAGAVVSICALAFTSN